MTSAPPPLPPDGPDTKRRSPFTWKTYLDAIIWIAPALVLSNFCAIVVHPRVEGIWEASGVETANRTIHWMKDFSGAGLFCAKVGLACLGLLIAGTEVMLKGHPQVRQALPDGAQERNFPVHHD